MNGSVATEPYVSRPSSWFDLLQGGSTVLILKEDAITRNLEAPSVCTVSNRHLIQRRGGACRVDDELRKGSNEDVWGASWQGEKSSPGGLSELWPALPGRLSHGHVAVAP